LFRQVDVERANVWAALEFCQSEPGEADRGVLICRNLFEYWLAYGHFSEVLGVLDALLERLDRPTRSRASALWLSAFLAVSQNDAEVGTRCATEALNIGRSTGDADSVAWGLTALAAASWVAGRNQEAVDQASEACDLARTMGLRFAMLCAMDVKGIAQLFHGNIDAAIETGNQGVQVSEELGETSVRGYLLHFLSLAQLRAGRPVEADGLARQGVELRSRLGDFMGIATLVEVLALVATTGGDHERATTLLGGADAIWQSTAGKRFQPTMPDHESTTTEARTRLGEKGFEAAYQRGLAMSRGEVADFALGRSAAIPRLITANAPGPPAVLSRREMEVAGLVAEGASNAQIAARLFISGRTVESHLASIFNKLGVDSRLQVARWVASVEAAAAV
jgi:non-specific serine/threonine protein kinase